MPTISKIRLTNVIYEGGGKRYNDQVFNFDGENGIFLLENGGGKTVFLQTVLQAINPHTDMADRKIRDTLSLDGSPAHIAIEWILNERPRRYGLTAVSLYMENNVLKSLKYAYDYDVNDKNDIEGLPFVIKTKNAKLRPADRGEMSDYYSKMKQQHLNAMTFVKKKDYHDYIKEAFKIIPSEWQKIGVINSSEGDIEAFFEHCKTTDQLVNNLLIPIIEDALQGKEKNDFAQTFEKQREHFKQNKRLLAEIDQFRDIKDKVDDYVQQYSGLHDAEMAYADVRKIAKGFMQYIIDQVVSYEDKGQFITEELKINQEDWQAYHHKKMSVKVYELDQQLEEVLVDQNIKKRALSKEIDGVNWIEQRIQNIEISKLSEKIAEQEGLIAINQALLASKEQDEEELETREKRQHLLHSICGAYLELLDDSNKNQGLIDHQLSREEDNLSQYKGRLDQKRETIAEQRALISSCQALIKDYERQMDQIQRAIFEPINEDNIAVYSDRWKKSNEQKEEERKDYFNRTKELEQENEALVQSLKSLSEEKVAIDQEKKINETHLSNLLSDQEKLLGQLESVFYDLTIYDGVYTKEESIRNSLKDKIERLSKDFEEALLSERINGRLADLYTDVPFYAADPFINKKIRQISHQVDYIAHGVEHLDQIKEATGLTIKALFERFPYWASSVVTTEKNKDKVVAFIEGFKEEMTMPLYVLSVDDIKSIVSSTEGNPIFEEAIFPYTWQDNLTTEMFEAWKEDVVVQADASKREREALQERLKHMQGIDKTVETYFNKYPNAYYNELIEAIDTGKKQVDGLQKEIRAKEDLHAKNLQEGKKIVKALEQLSQEITDLEQKYIKSLEFIKLIKFKRENQLQIKGYSQGMEILKNEEQILKDELKGQEDLLIEIRDSLSEAKQKISVIKEEPLYVNVKDLEPSYSDKSLNLLKIELDRVDDRLKGFDSSIRDIHNQIDTLKRQLEYDQGTIEDKKRLAEHVVELLSDFGHDELERLHIKLQKSKERRNRIQRQVVRSEKEQTRLETLKKAAMDDLMEKFEGLYVFDEALESVVESLISSKQALSLQENALKETLEENQKILASLGETKQSLQIEAVKHALGDIRLEGYDANDYIDYHYGRQAFFNRIQEDLEGGQNKFKKMAAHVQKHKENYLEFCKSTIKEAKLKDMAIKGIANKINYKDLQDYQQNMATVLNRSIRLAEDDRRESDAELQTFLTHLLSYAKNVLEELDAIQKKTKIKVDGAYKQIFLFTIPKWDELESKATLRHYINRLVSDYDAEEKKRLDDKEGLRQFIEKKLSVKNLIMQTLGDKSIKIKCRKVTNDLKINQAPLTWESSNKWSGGEKWSKNMTLFLSLLNYLAEKKQYLSVEQKRHRTVILDNPFGKASSKHVLDPVFFVAENLGFQMITVTAHAEGKFVTDYFPIVYSGKLRATSDASKQLMDMERSLNTVYLKTKSPDSLLRLEEMEQLSFLK